MKSLILILCFICVSKSHSTVVNKEIWINNGVSNIVDDPAIPYLAFNESPLFQVQNVIIQTAINDTLHVILHNNDTLNHGFAIKSISIPGGPIVLLPGESIAFDVPLPDFGAFIYYDDYNFPHYKSLGAAGIIHVSDSELPTFYWNMKEHDKAWNEAVTTGTFLPLADYDPLYFTINGVSNPETQDDPLSKIVGNVNDTLIIVINNTGQMAHSIHFHGYHATVQFSSKNPSSIGTTKDTFPILAMETLIIYLVPDKPGTYPVHDHNLVATSGNGYYANGLFQIIEIAE